MPGISCVDPHEVLVGLADAIASEVVATNARPTVARETPMRSLDVRDRPVGTYSILSSSTAVTANADYQFGPSDHVDKTLIGRHTHER